MVRPSGRAIALLIGVGLALASSSGAADGADAPAWATGPTLPLPLDHRATQVFDVSHPSISTTGRRVGFEEAVPDPYEYFPSIQRAGIWDLGSGRTRLLPNPGYGNRQPLLNGSGDLVPYVFEDRPSSRLLLVAALRLRNVRTGADRLVVYYGCAQKLTLHGVTPSASRVVLNRWEYYCDDSRRGEDNDFLQVVDVATGAVHTITSRTSEEPASSGAAGISDDGRWLAYMEQDVVKVQDLRTGTVRTLTDGADGASSDPSISGNGGVVAFTSSASNLVGGDDNDRPDVFVHDLRTGTTGLVSAARDGSSGAGESGSADVSDDGRFVAFDSTASDLVGGDVNGSRDVFVRDLSTGRTTRVSVTTDGRQRPADSSDPALSGNGEHVAFRSEAVLSSLDQDHIPSIYVR